MVNPTGPPLAEYKINITVRAGKMCNVNALGVYVWETVVFFR